MMKTKMTKVKLKIFEHDPFLLYILNAIPFPLIKRLKLQQPMDMKYLSIKNFMKN